MLKWPSQIIASCSTVYDIPWPTSFLAVVSNMRVFLVDVISITKGTVHLWPTIRSALGVPSALGGRGWIMRNGLCKPMDVRAWVCLGVPVS